MTGTAAEFVSARVKRSVRSVEKNELLSEWSVPHATRSRAHSPRLVKEWGVCTRNGRIVSSVNIRVLDDPVEKLGRSATDVLERVRHLKMNWCGNVKAAPLRTLACHYRHRRTAYRGGNTRVERTPHYAGMAVLPVASGAARTGYARWNAPKPLSVIQ